MFTIACGFRSRARSSSRTRFLATWKSQGGEAAAEGEAWQPLVDPQEDLLRQILGQRPVADHPEHVVEHRPLVHLEEHLEGAFVPLALAEGGDGRVEVEARLCPGPLGERSIAPGLHQANQDPAGHPLRRGKSQ